MTTTADDTAARDTIEALRPFVEAMFDQTTVYARARNGAGEISEDWFEAVVTEIRRPSPYNVEWGTVCVRRTDGQSPGVTYIYPPVCDCLSLTDPRAT